MNVEIRKGCALFVCFKEEEEEEEKKQRKSRYETQLEFQRVIMVPEYDSSTRIRIFA